MFSQFARSWVTAETAIIGLKSFMNREVSQPWLEISRKKPLEKNRLEAHIEQAVVNMAYDYPAYDQHRMANELNRQEIMISGSVFAPFGCATTRETLKNAFVPWKLR